MLDYYKINGSLRFSPATCYTALRYFTRRERASVDSVSGEFRREYYADNVRGMIEAAKRGLEELEERNLPTSNNASFTPVVAGVPVVSVSAPVMGVRVYI
jgi:hypothetical protein